MPGDVQLSGHPCIALVGAHLFYFHVRRGIAPCIQLYNVPP